MFTEPQSLTVATVAKTLPRVAFGDQEGVFQTSDAGFKLRITHILRNRNRRTVRLDITKTAADPLLDGVSRPYSMSVYCTVDHPQVGFSNQEVEDNLKALVDWLSVAGNATKLVGGES